MLTEKQQALWQEEERTMIAGLEARMASLIRCCDTIQPLIANATNGFHNANRGVIACQVTLAEARMDLELISEHRARYAAALASHSDTD